MILLKEIRGVHLVSWFPGVVAFRVALPLYEILECSGSSVELMVPDLFHFVLFLIIDQVRWGMGVVWTVGRSFDVWGKEGCVEDQVYCP